MISIWVDADSCPLPVREIILRFSKRLSFSVFFVANRPIPLNNAKNCTMILTESTPDAADDYIVEHIDIDDIAITRDIPLAHRLVEKKIVTINDRGVLFSDSNIAQRLAIRNLNVELVENGLTVVKTSSYGKKELNNFANCLDREINKKIKK